MQSAWPDTRDFWHGKRVLVTGGSGFLGSYVVDKLAARGAAKVFVPRKREYDLCVLENVKSLLADTSPDVVDPPGGPRRRHRREPRASGASSSTTT